MNPEVELVMDHVRPVGPAPSSGLWSLVKVIAKSVTLSLRFLGAFLVGKGDLAYADKLMGIFWRCVFQWGNARLLVENRAVFTGRTAIVMSNHTSLLDIPALLGSVPGPVRMVFKESLAKVPIWGWAVVAAGFVPIDRGNRAKAIAQLEHAKGVFAKGVHVWVSPEGTRSRGRGLLPFKKGGFHLAKQLGAPIIPAFIEGTEQMISPTSIKVVQDGVVRVRFGQPIETEGKDVLTIMNETRAAIIALGAVPCDQGNLGRSSAKRSPSFA